LASELGKEKQNSTALLLHTAIISARKTYCWYWYYWVLLC